MDTSNSALNVSVAELLISNFPEDQKTAKQCIECIRLTLQKLKPILGYITKPSFLYREKTQGGFETAGVHCSVLVECSPSLAKAPPRLVVTQFGSLISVERQMSHDNKDTYRLVHNHHSDIFRLIEESDTGWQRWPFDTVLAFLQKLLQEAEDKRRKHLEAVSKRNDMLKQILEIVRA
jgi:hypothetical protein